MLHTYYNEKLIELITNSEVTKILDEESSERKKKFSSSELTIFDNQEEKLFRVKTRFIQTYTPNNDKKEIFQKVKVELDKIQTNSENLFNTIDRDIDLQKSNFEERMKQKNGKTSKYLIIFIY